MIEFTPEEASQFLQAVVNGERINSGTNIQDFAIACYRMKTRAAAFEAENGRLRAALEKIERECGFLADDTSVLEMVGMISNARRTASVVLKRVTE